MHTEMSKRKEPQPILANMKLRLCTSLKFLLRQVGMHMVKCHTKKNRKEARDPNLSNTEKIRKGRRRRRSMFAVRAATCRDPNRACLNFYFVFLMLSSPPLATHLAMLAFLF